MQIAKDQHTQSASQRAATTVLNQNFVLDDDITWMEAFVGTNLGTCVDESDPDQNERIHAPNLVPLDAFEEESNAKDNDKAVFP